MGYWSTNESGDSFAIRAEGEPEMYWGDQPADALESALGSIVKMFQETFGRKPMAEEIRAGLEFSIDSALEDRGPIEPKVYPPELQATIDASRKTIRQIYAEFDGQRGEANHS